MKFCLASFVSMIAAFAVSGASFAQSSVSAVSEGVSAYRSGDYEHAWRLLEAESRNGSAKAQRYVGYIILESRAPEASNTDMNAGVAMLKQAAMTGDYAALIRLEDLRRQNLPHSPSLEDMIAIERARAEAGDPVSAWRLARRYEDGDGVSVSERDAAKWLEIAASTGTARFPKAGEAAFRLCQINALGADARNPDAARRWCAVAAENGHAGAAIVLRRLASLQANLPG